MKNILTFKDSVLLTYNWTDIYDHGICGHTYEVIDYFYILSKYTDVKILLVVDFDICFFRKIIENKYSFTKKEIDNIIFNTTIKTRDEIKEVTYIYSKVILVTDGFYVKEHKFMTNHLLCFLCYIPADKQVYDIKNLTILQDSRIYPVVDNSINYVKKILLSKIKKPTKQSDKILIYTNKNLRKIDISKYDRDKVVCVTNDEKLPGYTYLDLPVDNIFDEFNEYIYTPVSSQFDCSSRFIVECAYFNKKVTYDIDYHDIGLEVRKQDILNSNLELTDDDFIVQYIINL